MFRNVLHFIGQWLRDTRPNPHRISLAEAALRKSVPLTSPWSYKRPSGEVIYFDDFTLERGHLTNHHPPPKSGEGKDSSRNSEASRHDWTQA
jgi:hypothetical protein